MTVVSGGSGKGTKSPIKIMANIFISFIGAGVLGLPFAFKEAGIIEGIVTLTLVGITSVKAMLLIIDCKKMLMHKSTTPSGVTKVETVGANGLSHSVSLPDVTSAPTSETEILLMTEEKEEVNGVLPNVKTPQMEEPSKPEAPGQELNYGDIGYYAIGHIGRVLVESALLLSQVGFCCAYLIFISENLSDHIKGVQLVHWLGILLPPLCLLTLIRHLGNLAYCSLFAQISNLMAFAVVFWFDFEHFSKIDIHPKKMRLDGFPFFIAIAIYCYEVAGMILSLESSLHKEVRSAFKLYFKVTIIMVTLLYIAFGACGYLSFGPETNAIITLNLPKGASLDFAMVVKACLCLGLFFTYPIMMFPVIELLEKKLLPSPEKKWQGNILRFLMVGVTGMVVLAIPNFANLMALVGATLCTLLAYILPGIFHIQIYKKYKGKMTTWKYILDIILIIIGIAGAIIGTWDAVKRLNTGPPMSPETLVESWLNDTNTSTDPPTPAADVVKVAANMWISSTASTLPMGAGANPTTSSKPLS